VAVALVALLTLGLILFGARVHWVEEAGSAERDGFVAQAETMRDGRLPRDPFRGFLYPLLVAGVAEVVGDAFTAARLVSNLAAVGLAVLAWALAVRLGGPWAGVWALLLMAVNPNLWILGQHVTTDALFAALGGLVWWAGLAYLERGREPGGSGERRTVVIGAAAFALAFSTRTSALFLLPGVLLAWWWSPARRQGRGLRQLLAAAALAAVLVVPHFVLRARVFGNPLHDENWKNLAFKLYGFPDWSYLERVPYGGLWGVVTGDPAAVLRGFASELTRFATSGLGQLLGTQLHAILLGVGAWVLWRRAPRRVLMLLGAALAFVAAVALVFFTWGRLVLVVLPVLCALLAAGWREIEHWDRLRPWRAPVGLGSAVLAGAVALLAAKTFFFRLPAFVERHPYATVAALRELEAATPPGTVLAGTSPFLDRYVDRPYLYVPDAFGPEVADPALYYARLHDLLAAAGAAYLVADTVDLRDRPASLLGDEPPMPWLEPAGDSDGARVWRIRPGDRASR
jgi:4-amino-4-deoxy-L-arabinose transferase-like glycosyltransferase